MNYKEKENLKNSVQKIFDNTCKHRVNEIMTQKNKTIIQQQSTNNSLISVKYEIVEDEQPKIRSYENDEIGQQLLNEERFKLKMEEITADTEGIYVPRLHEHLIPHKKDSICPYCGNDIFYAGARGGLAQNMLCAKCFHEFNSISFGYKNTINQAFTHGVSLARARFPYGINLKALKRYYPEGYNILKNNSTWFEKIFKTNF